MLLDPAGLWLQWKWCDFRAGDESHWPLPGPLEPPCCEEAQATQRGPTAETRPPPGQQCQQHTSKSEAAGPHETSSLAEVTCVSALNLNWLGPPGLPGVGLPWGTPCALSIRGRPTLGFGSGFGLGTLKRVCRPGGVVTACSGSEGGWGTAGVT